MRQFSLVYFYILSYYMAYFSVFTVILLILENWLQLYLPPPQDYDSITPLKSNSLQVYEKIENFIIQFIEAGYNDPRYTISTVSSAAILGVSCSSDWSFDNLAVCLQYYMQDNRTA